VFVTVWALERFRPTCDSKQAPKRQQTIWGAAARRPAETSPFQFTFKNEEAGHKRGVALARPPGR